jgi:hypothetical protein
MRQRYKKNNIIYRGLEKGSDLLNSIFRNPRLILLCLLFGAIFLFVALYYRRFLFTGILIGLASISMIYQRYFRYSHYFGVELCMMATALAGRAYGPHYGAFTGFFSIFFAFIISGNFKYSSFVSLLTLPLIGAIVPLFGELSLLYLGLLMTVLYDIIILPLYMMLGSRLFPSIVFFLTHLLFNYWIFTTIAPFIFSFM